MEASSEAKRALRFWLLDIMGGDNSCLEAVGTFSNPRALVDPSTWGIPRAVVLIEKVGPATIELLEDTILSVLTLK